MPKSELRSLSKFGNFGYLVLVLVCDTDFEHHVMAYLGVKWFIKVNNICEKLDLFRKVVLHILILHCDCEALILQNRRGNFEYFSDDEYKHFNYMLICRVWQWNQTFGKSPNMVNQKKYSFPKWHKGDQQPNQGQTKQFLHLKNHL